MDYHGLVGDTGPSLGLRESDAVKQVTLSFLMHGPYVMHIVDMSSCRVAVGDRYLPPLEPKKVRKRRYGKHTYTHHLTAKVAQARKPGDSYPIWVVKGEAKVEFQL